MAVKLLAIWFTAFVCVLAIIWVSIWVLFYLFVRLFWFWWFLL